MAHLFFRCPKFPYLQRLDEFLVVTRSSDAETQSKLLLRIVRAHSPEMGDFLSQIVCRTSISPRSSSTLWCCFQRHWTLFQLHGCRSAWRTGWSPTSLPGDTAKGKGWFWMVWLKSNAAIIGLRWIWVPCISPTEFPPSQFFLASYSSLHLLPIISHLTMLNAKKKTIIAKERVETFCQVIWLWVLNALPLCSSCSSPHFGF